MASRLLRLIETEEPELVELTADAHHFVAEALG
jgi:phosphodiesterase/alkaline phosphatase D-like protein